MEGILVHIDLCESMLSDLVESASQIQGEFVLEGLLLATESLLTYILEIDRVTRTQFPSTQTTASSVIESIVEIVAMLENL